LIFERYDDTATALGAVGGVRSVVGVDEPDAGVRVPIIVARPTVAIDTNPNRCLMVPPSMVEVPPSRSSGRATGGFLVVDRGEARTGHGESAACSRDGIG
jgi:hypothetical protein